MNTANRNVSRAFSALWRRPFALVFTTALAALLLPTQGKADVLFVENLNNSGAGSLANTIAAADPGDIITFNLNLNGGSIVLAGTEIVIDKDLTIDASTLPEGITIDGDGDSLVLEVTVGSTVSLNNVTITGGNNGVGGGILNRGNLWLTECRVVGNNATGTGGAIDSSFSNLYLINSTVSGNTCDNCSGIYQFLGELTIISSTISGNSGNGTSEAIRVETFGAATTMTLIMFNSTVSGNTSGALVAGVNMTAEDSGFTEAFILNCTITDNRITGAGTGAGLRRTEAGGATCDVTVNNSIVAGNTVQGVPFDIQGLLVAAANNIVGVGGGLTDGVDDNRVGITAPKLGPLKDNGGPTLTHMPTTGSLAVDGAFDNGLDFDQRGFARPLGAGLDIGAVEGVDHSAAKAQLLIQIKKLQKKLKTAKRKGDKRKVKKLNKQIKTLKRNLAAL